MDGGVLARGEREELARLTARSAEAVSSAREAVRGELEASGLKLGDFDFQQRAGAAPQRPFFLEAAGGATFQRIMAEELRTGAPRYEGDAIALERRTRELAREQRLLDEQRRAHARESAQLRGRAERLAGQRAELAAARRRFSALQAENAAKKAGALARMGAELAQEEQLRGDEARYRRLQAGLALYVRQLQVAYVPALEVYEAFLRRVCDAGEQFQSPELVQRQFQRVYEAKQQYEKQLLEIQEQQRKLKQEQDEEARAHEQALAALRARQQAVDTQLARRIDRSGHDDAQLQMQKARASRQSIVYSNIVSGIDNLYARALQISRRGPRLRLRPEAEAALSVEEKCIEKIRIVKHVIAGLNRFKAEVIDRSEFRRAVYSAYNRQRVQALEASGGVGGPTDAPGVADSAHRAREGHGVTSAR